MLLLPRYLKRSYILCYYTAVSTAAYNIYMHTNWTAKVIPILKNLYMHN